MENSTTKQQLVLENLIKAIDVIFESSLTLEQLSSMKILVTFWNKPSIREKLLFVVFEFVDSGSPSNSQIWREIQYEIAIDVAHLQLPKKLCQKLWDINSYISKSLLYWLIYSYYTFFDNAPRCIDPLTWKSYFYITLNLFWNALNKSNSYEMEFCNEDETCTKFENYFLSLWYNIPKSLETRIHQDAEMIALVLYFLPWNTCQHVIQNTILKIEDYQKKPIIESKYGRLKCIYFIKNNEWQFYNLYTSCMLANKEELFQYKRYLINKEGEQIAVYFFKNRAIKNGKEYLQFCKKLDNQIDDKVFFVEYFIKYRYWDLLEIYLRLYCDEKYQYEVKKRLLTEEGFRLIEILIENTARSVQRQFLAKFFEKESKSDEDNAQRLRRYFFEKLGQCDSKSDFEVFVCFVKWSVESNAEWDEGNLRILGEAVSRYFNADLRGKKVDDILSNIFQSGKDFGRDQFRDRYLREGEIEH